tara:strand:+ start:606 stop:839 length:234 start_codon:yes stop_codon:yes gene_type:complete
MEPMPEETPVYDTSVGLLAMENWEAKTSVQDARPLRAGESLIGALESFARPSGEMVGGHCEDATFLTGAFMYLQVIE